MGNCSGLHVQIVQGFLMICLQSRHQGLQSSAVTNSEIINNRKIVGGGNLPVFYARGTENVK